METAPDTVFFAGPDAFAAWLEAHGSTADEVWVRMAKKGTGIESLDWPHAVEVVLCFGWIDGQSRRIDDAWFVQRFTPRRPRSIWSKINRQKVEALIAAGRMRPAGLAEVEREGRWAVGPGLRRHGHGLRARGPRRRARGCRSS